MDQVDAGQVALEKILEEVDEKFVRTGDSFMVPVKWIKDYLKAYASLEHESWSWRGQQEEISTLNMMDGWSDEYITWLVETERLERHLESSEDMVEADSPEELVRILRASVKNKEVREDLVDDGLDLREWLGVDAQDLSEIAWEWDHEELMKAVEAESDEAGAMLLSAGFIGGLKHIHDSSKDVVYLGPPDDDFRPDWDEGEDAWYQVRASMQPRDQWKLVYHLGFYGSDHRNPGDPSDRVGVLGALRDRLVTEDDIVGEADDPSWEWDLSMFAAVNLPGSPVHMLLPAFLRSALVFNLLSSGQRAHWASVLEEP
jgi:hypothetical protein